MKKTLKDFFDALGDDFTKGLCIALSIILLFSAGNFVGLLTSVNTQSIEEIQSTDSAVPVQATVQQTTQQVTVTTTAVQTTTLPQVSETTVPNEAAVPSETTTTAPASTAPQTKAEIVAYFNECSDKVKTDATKVVRNYTDNQLIEDQLILPSALEGLFNSLAGNFLKKDETPLELTTKEDIIAMYPSQKQTWSSKATEADVAEATCIEDGDYYNITLKFYPQDNPVVGSGVGATFFIIGIDAVKEKIPGLQTLSTNYYDCTVQAKIEKATGHVVWSYYSTPLVANVSVNVLVKTVDAQLGLIIINDYSITY